jgi:hypothetical protein
MNKMGKIVAVICKDAEDFQIWSMVQKHKPTKRNSPRDYFYKNKRYIGIVSVLDSKGYTFDEIYTTDLAMMNKEYNKIVEIVNFNLIQK